MTSAVSHYRPSDLLIRKGIAVEDDAHEFADGGGIRGYSALLILQKLMKVIGRIEREYDCGPNEADGRAESSYHPLEPLSPCGQTDTRSEAKNCGKPSKTESSLWLPCHYFDYIAGTSTGGCVSYAMDFTTVS